MRRLLARIRLAYDLLRDYEAEQERRISHAEVVRRIMRYAPLPEMTDWQRERTKESAWAETVKRRAKEWPSS